MNFHRYWELSVSITEWIRKKLTIRQTENEITGFRSDPRYLNCFYVRFVNKKIQDIFSCQQCLLLFHSAERHLKLFKIITFVVVVVVLRILVQADCMQVIQKCIYCEFSTFINHRFAKSLDSANSHFSLTSWLNMAVRMP